VPFEEVGVGCWGGGVVWRWGGGDFRGFADCAFVSWLVIALGLRGDVRIRFMVGDLELNFGVDILRDTMKILDVGKEIKYEEGKEGIL
jgi:hypothetical protein